jgi:hypothetical protein
LWDGSDSILLAREKRIKQKGSDKKSLKLTKKVVDKGF